MDCEPEWSIMEIDFSRSVAVGAKWPDGFRSAVSRPVEQVADHPEVIEEMKDELRAIYSLRAS